ncbi:MAG: sulfite exporter TauE/SafE family protein [Pseudomonadota bacterium]
MFEPLTITLVLAAFLVGGFVKGAIGLGLPVVVLAALALVMPLRDALAIFLIPAIASNIWQATNGPFLGTLLRRMWSFLLGAVIGIVIGVTIAAGTKSEIMVLILGVGLMFYSLYSLLAPRLPEPGTRETWMSPAAGASGGVLFGMTGLFIVPGILYLEALRMPRNQFVQALGLTFITISGTLAIAMTSHALVTWNHAILSAMGLVPVFIGLTLGRRARHRISEDGFRKLFFVALIFVGLYMIARTLMN